MLPFVPTLTINLCGGWSCERRSEKERELNPLSDF